MKPSDNLKVAYNEPVSYLEDVSYMEDEADAPHSDDHNGDMQPVSEFIEESAEEISEALKDLGSLLG